MRILVISQYYYPEDFRINDICEELVKRGNEVTVVTGRPNYPQGVIYEGYENSHRIVSMHNGVRIIRCKNRPRKKGGFNLLLNYFSFQRKATKVINKIKGDFDVIFCYQLSPIMQVIPGIKYKKIHNKPLFLYVCDIWPESIRDYFKKGMSTNNIIYKYFLRLSQKIYKEADMISTKCEEFIDYLVDICKVSRKICKVNYEHAESNYLSVNEQPINNGVIDFMYLGNIGHSSNCNLIVKAASLIDADNFKIHFVGEGSELDNIKKMSKDLKVEDKIIFHGKHPQSEIIDFYNLADVCLLTLANDSAIGFTPPAKLTGYMAACRPIVGAIDGAAKRIVSDANCGFVCKANDFLELSSIMNNIINNPSIVDGMGKNGRYYFLQKFTLERYMDDLISDLNVVVTTYNNRGLSEDE